MTIIDRFSKDEIAKLACECTNMSQFTQRLGYKSKSCYKTVRAKCEEYGISLDHFTGVAENAMKRTPENVFIINSTASQAVLRRLYKKNNYSEYKCSICGLEPYWNGKELTLTLDHINGINNDDRLENLRWVCPNCDRQLDTFGSKNANRETYYNYHEEKNNYCIDCGRLISYGSTRCPDCYGKSIRKVERPSKEVLEKVLIENRGNFTKVSHIYNVTDNAIRKWCRSYNLPTHSSDYKN